MWIIRCAQACRGVVLSHPIVAAVPAAVVTIGAGAALSMLTAQKPPMPQLPCGCHQVWVAPVVPMTPATYGSVIRSLGDAALAGIPLADAPGGSIVCTPPIGVVPPALLVPVTAIVPPRGSKHATRCPARIPARSPARITARGPGTRAGLAAAASCRGVHAVRNAPDRTTGLKPHPASASIR